MTVQKRLCIILFVMASSMPQAMAQKTPKAEKAIIEDSLFLDEVVVTGSRIPVSRQVLSSPVTLVGRNLLERGESTTILPALMQNVPGLYVSSRGVSGYGVSNGAAGNITMRGFSSSNGRILILVDGHPQYASIYGHAVADSYVTESAERVEIIRGSASVLYGSNAMGGAINIITRGSVPQEGNHLTLKGTLGSYGTRRYALNESYSHHRLSLSVGGSYEKSDGHRLNSDYENLSSHGRIGYDLSRIWNVSTNVSLSHINTKNPGLVSDPMIDGTTDVMRGMIGVSFKNNSKTASGAINAYYNWGKNKINDGHAIEQPPQEYLFHSTDYMGGVTVFETFHPFQGNTLTGGLDLTLFGGNAYRNPTTEYYADHIKLHEMAGYMQTQQEIGPVTLSAGLRLNHHKKYGYEWIPQAGISLKTSSTTTIKFNFSKGYRSPSIRELYMYVSANEDLLPERSYNYDLGLSQSFLEGRIQMELNLFHVKGDNIVQVVRTDGRPRNQNVGAFKNKGVEFAMGWNILPSLRLTGNYSLLDMDTPLLDSPSHKAYVSLTKKWQRFQMAVGYQWVGGLYLETGENEEKTCFGLLDARIDFTASDDLSFFIKGDNLLARRYETIKGFPMPKATIMGGFTLSL